MTHPDRPVSIHAVARNYPNGALIGEHCHIDGQFIHATAGVMEIRAAHRMWLIPPQRALWIPPRVPHGLRARGAVSLRTLYIAQDDARDVSDAPRGFVVPPLLRQLILQALEPCMRRDLQRQRHLNAVLMDELRALVPDALSLAMPSDPRLARACADILARPDDEHRIERLAQESGASVRTLTRLAQDELGCPLSTWRQQARILSSIPMLIAGKQVTSVAHSMGYETPGAYSAMFKRMMGVQPHLYRQSPGPNELPLAEDDAEAAPQHPSVLPLEF